MNIGRRSVTLAGVLAATLGYVGFRHFASFERQFTRLIENEFGPSIAAAPAARQFVTDMAAFAERAGAKTVDPDEIVMVFLRTTNVIRVLETEGELVFIGLGLRAVDAPCQNTLSAGWL